MFIVMADWGESCITIFFLVLVIVPELRSLASSVHQSTIFGARGTHCIPQVEHPQQNRDLQLDLILLRALNPLSQLALAMGMTETSSNTAIIFVKCSSCLYFWWLIDPVTDLRFEQLERRCIYHFMWKLNMYVISNGVVKSDNHWCDHSLSAD